MSSYRLEAQKLNVGSRAILSINAYFPVDDNMNTEELVTLLTEMEVLIKNDGTNNFIIGGDINYDKTRSSKAALIIKDWLVKMDLSSVWEKFQVDFTHHHINFSSV